MKRYIGRRTCEGPVVRVETSRATRPLEGCLDVDHFPSHLAFDWGRKSRGTTILALLLLLDLTGEKDVAERYCTRFVDEVLLPMQSDRWELDMDWLADCVGDWLLADLAAGDLAAAEWLDR